MFTRDQSSGLWQPDAGCAEREAGSLPNEVKGGQSTHQNLLCFDLDNDNLTEKCMCGHCKPPLFLPPNVEKNFVSDLDLIIFFTSDFRFLLDQISSKVLHYISKDDQSWLQIDLKDELIQYSMCPSFNVINIMMTFCWTWFDFSV